MDILGIVASTIAILLAAWIIFLVRKLRGLLAKEDKDTFSANYGGAANIRFRATTAEPLRSKHNYTKTEIIFDNRLTEPVDIFWINYQGGRKLYHTLGPNQTRKQTTFVTHPWIIARHSTGKEVRRIIVDGSVGRVIIED